MPIKISFTYGNKRHIVSIEPEEIGLKLPQGVEINAVGRVEQLSEELQKISKAGLTNIGTEKTYGATIKVITI